MDEALAALRSSPSTIDGVSPSRIFHIRVLKNPELPSISDRLDVELLSKERQVRKEEARVKRNTKVSKYLERYAPVAGDLVFLQDRKSLKWDIPATVQQVRESGRSTYCLTENGDVFLQSHRFIRKRPGVESVDAIQDPDTALTEQADTQVSTDSAQSQVHNEDETHSVLLTAAPGTHSMLKPSIAPSCHRTQPVHKTATRKEDGQVQH